MGEVRKYMEISLVKNDFQVDEISKQLQLPAQLAIESEYQPGEPLKVEKNGNSCKITYGQRVELFRGLGLLAEHCQEENYSTEQSARFSMNGAMLDCSRNGVMNMSATKQMIRYMALMGLNMLMLYTEDTYEVPEYPYFGYMRGRYSQSQLQELDAYAKGYGIELIPCMQTLAHLAPTLRWECFDEIKDTNDILLCGEEKTYEFIEAMIRACRNSFSTDRIHIGMDEAFMLGLGKFREKNGIYPREEIFCDHLHRVNEICQKYNFRPMIWSDMFYRVTCAGAYDASTSISKKIRAAVPENVDLVYWEYSIEQKEGYEKPLRSHQQFRNNLVFAGGAWRWLGFTPHIEMSQRASRAALEACIDNGVKEVFCTAWGDEGNECSMFPILPTLQLYAEYSYQGAVDDVELAKRLKTCTGENLNDMMLMDLPDMPDGVYHVLPTNPSCYLLYSDVLGSVFEKHCHPCYKENYTKYAQQLKEAAKRSRDLGYMYQVLADLCDLLAVKSCVSIDAYQAYQSDDRENLRRIAEKTLPEIKTRLETFRASLELRWVKEFKRSGYEVMDLRLGGVSARVNCAIRQIKAYLSGNIDTIEEMDEKRLPFSNKTEAEVEKDPVMCWGFRKEHFTANRFFW